MNRELYGGGKSGLDSVEKNNPDDVRELTNQNCERGNAVNEQEKRTEPDIYQLLRTSASSPSFANAKGVSYRGVKLKRFFNGEAKADCSKFEAFDDGGGVAFPSNPGDLVGLTKIDSLAAKNILISVNK